MIAGPLVSVVIPAFNAAKYIRETLDSVLAQTYRPIEIVVVDDGSTDGTREQILAYGDRVRYVWQPNSGGCSSPRNHGVRMASGEFVAFLDADDLIAPERIAAAVAVMKRHPDVGLALTNFVHFDSAGVDPTDHFATCPLLGVHLEGRRSLRRTPWCCRPRSARTFCWWRTSARRRPSCGVRPSSRSAASTKRFPPTRTTSSTIAIAERYPIAIIPDVLMQKRRHDAEHDRLSRPDVPRADHGPSQDCWRPPPIRACGRRSGRRSASTTSGWRTTTPAATTGWRCATCSAAFGSAAGRASVTSPGSSRTSRAATPTASDTRALPGWTPSPHR